MKNIKLLFLTFSILFGSKLYAAAPNIIESICLDSVDVFERAINQQLAPEYYIEKIHKSDLGPMMTNELYIRDIIIRKKYREQDRAEFIMFPYISGSYSYGRRLGMQIIIRLNQLILGKSEKETVLISFGIICNNNKLEREIRSMLEREDIVNAIKEELLKDEFIGYKEHQDEVEIVLQ